MLEHNLANKINDIASFLKQHLTETPKNGLILGSGLGTIIDDFETKIVIPYTDIPHLPTSTAPGHSGCLVIGKIMGHAFITMQGRLHLYEGHSPQIATIMVRVMKKLGVERIFITCASGGLNKNFNVGDIMLITDHINFTGTNPLIGANLDEFGPRFPPMFDIYTKKLQNLALSTANEVGIKLQSGVYAATFGPTYSTRAEYRFYIDSHCDAIGMSVVQEAIVAAHSGMEILAFAAITDIARHDVDHHVTHEEVTTIGKQIAYNLTKLLEGIIHKLN